MSDMFRKSMLNKLPQLPPTRAPWADEPDVEDIDEEDEENEQGDAIGELGPVYATCDQVLSELIFDFWMQDHGP